MLRAPYGANKNIARIAKLPYGAKKGFIQRKVVFKERFFQSPLLLSAMSAMSALSA